MKNRWIQLLLVGEIGFVGIAKSQSADTNFTVKLSPEWHVIWPQLAAGADRYQVQSSPDLLEWHGLEGLTNISSQLATNGWFDAVLPAAVVFQGPQQFFRVVATGRLGETVESAEILTGGGTYPGTTEGFQNNLSAGTSCSGTAGVDRFYRITVPSFQRLTASVNNPSTIVFDPSISLMQVPLPGTTNPACIATDDSGSRSTVNTVTYANGAAPTDIFIRIDTSSSTSPGGPFTLTVVLSALLVGETFALPENSSSNGVVSGSTLDYLNDAASYPGKSAPGRDRFYAVTLPPGLRLSASLLASSFNAMLVMLDGTDAEQSLPPTLGIADQAAAGIAETLNYLNTRATNMQVILGIDASSTAASGDFQLTLVTGLPPAGDVPGTAEMLSSVGSTNGTTAGFVNDLTSYPGFTSQPGSDRFYRFAVPAGQVLKVTVAPTNFNVTVALLDAASAQGPNPVVLSLANASSSSTGAETASWINTSGNATEVIIAVDSVSPSASGNFSLNLALSDPLPGETPVTAETLVSTGTHHSTTVGYMNNLALASSCTGFGTAGADRFFQILLTAGTTLTASVTPTSNWDPAIYLIRAGEAANSAPTCLAGDDSGPAAATNTASYTNTSGMDEMIVIAVDAFSSSGSGTFDLITSIH